MGNVIVYIYAAAFHAVIVSSGDFRYTVPWPLHLVLSDRNLEDYNRIFVFLMTVKRTQLGLHKVWAVHMREKVEW